MRKSPLCLLLVLALAAPASARNRAKELSRRLETARGEERLTVITALGGSGSGKAVETLLWTLDVRNSPPRESTAVVRSLGRLGSRKALGPLMQAWDYLGSLRLRGELPPRLRVLRAELVEALGRIKSRKAVPVLRQALRDSDPRVVRRACEAFGRLREKKAVPLLLELLRKGGDSRQAALEALGDIGSKTGEGTLERVMRSSDPEVRVPAAYALARLGDVEGLKALRAILDEGERFHRSGILAAYYLARLEHDIGMEYLLAVVADADPDLKLLAVEALGKSGYAKAIVPLAERHLKAESPELRLAVVAALGRLGGKRAVYHLHEASKDPDRTVAKAARLALADNGVYSE